MKFWHNRSMKMKVKIGANARVYFNLEVEDLSDEAINRALDEVPYGIAPGAEIGDLSERTEAFLLDEERAVPGPYTYIVEGEYDNPCEVAESLAKIPKAFRLQVLLEAVKHNLEQGEVGFASEIVSEFGNMVDF
jgi:hypothetical protein